jgi:hypothetical protein
MRMDRGSVAEGADCSLVHNFYGRAREDGAQHSISYEGNEVSNMFLRNAFRGGGCEVTINDDRSINVKQDDSRRRTARSTRRSWTRN